MNHFDQTNVFNNVVVRLGNIELPGGREELVAIFEKHVLELLTGSADTTDQILADTLRYYFDQKSFSMVASNLRSHAETWGARVVDMVRNWRPTPDNDTSAMFELARRNVAFADLMARLADRMVELNN